MNYIRRKGHGTNGKDAVTAFKQSWKESQGDGGEDLGYPDSSYHVSRGDVRAQAEPYTDAGESEGSKAPGPWHAALSKAGYTHVKTDETGTHYVMRTDDGEHRVRVTRESTGGVQARIRTKRGGVLYADSIDQLNAALPRRQRAAESVAIFWRRYLRD